MAESAEVPLAKPLWLQLRNHPRLFCLHPTRDQLSTLLDYLADVVEWRGDAGQDLGPGETAEWLRFEAGIARQPGAWPSPPESASP